MMIGADLRKPRRFQRVFKLLCGIAFHPVDDLLEFEAAVKYADHVLHIGHEVFFGTKEEYLKSASSRTFLKGGEANG